MTDAINDRFTMSPVWGVLRCGGQCRDLRPLQKARLDNEGIGSISNEVGSLVNVQTWLLPRTGLTL